jgi:hypothetical protein
MTFIARSVPAEDPREDAVDTSGTPTAAEPPREELSPQQRAQIVAEIRACRAMLESKTRGARL